MENVVTNFKTHCLDVCFLLHVPILLLRHLPAVRARGPHNEPLHAGETPRGPLRAHCRRERGCKIVRACHRGGVLEEVIEKM